MSELKCMSNWNLTGKEQIYFCQKYTSTCMYVLCMYHVSIRLTLVIHVMNNYIVVGQTTLFWSVLFTFSKEIKMKKRVFFFYFVRNQIGFIQLSSKVNPESWSSCTLILIFQFQGQKPLEVLVLVIECSRIFCEKSKHSLKSDPLMNGDWWRIVNVLEYTQIVRNSIYTSDPWMKKRIHKGL